jgi:transglutaminase-like putative cysteine protease
VNKSFFSQRFFSFSFILAMAMLAFEASSGITVFCILMLFWKWGSEAKSWPKLSRKVTGALSVLLFAGILLKYRTLMQQEPAFTFLLGLAALKIVDYVNARDHKFLVLLGFLLLAAKSLFTLDFIWVFPSAIALIGLWSSLLPSFLKHRARYLMKIFVYSLPLTILLFFAFPRIVLPWAISKGGDTQGDIGFSDETNPGRMSEIAASPNVAFRVKLENIYLNKPKSFYWRGAVLSNSKGLSWRPGHSELKITADKDISKEIFYDVAIEATSQNFLFALDGSTAIDLPENTVLNSTFLTFKTVHPLIKSAVYRGYWNNKWVDSEKPNDDFLQIPSLRGRSLQWVEAIEKKKLNVDKKLGELKKLFSTDFTYTLKPGSYREDELNSFLFDRKKGFCEHFAGAYATLARALGIPARVVVGYQGGRYNPVGEFWKVSQKDAHAWVEIYTEKSWKRIDPTTWVAPLRLEIGGEEFFALSEEDQKYFSHTLQKSLTSQNNVEFWDKLTFWFEDLNYRWVYFLLEYDKSSQEGLLSKIFNYNVSTLMIFIFVLIFNILLFRKLLSQRSSKNQAQMLIDKVENFGKKRGLSRAPSEPPLAYLKRLAKELPELNEALSLIETYYDHRMYAGLAPQISGHAVLRFWKARLNHISSNKKEADE